MWWSANDETVRDLTLDVRHSSVNDIDTKYDQSIIVKNWFYYFIISHSDQSLSLAYQ